MAEEETKTLEDLSELGGGEDSAAPEAPVYEQELDAQGRAYATGRRKDAVARVWIKPGPGRITVNGKDQCRLFRAPCVADDLETTS